MGGPSLDGSGPDRLEIGGAPLWGESERRGRRSTIVLVFATVGLAAFVASVVFDWVSRERSFLVDGGFGARDDVTVTTGLPGAPYSEAYMAGIVGLLGILVALYDRPGLAARLRLGATGLGLGLAGLVAAIVADAGTLQTLLFNGDAEIGERAYLPGVYCAVGAVVVLVAGVWLAARADGAGPEPAHREARPPGAVARLVGGQAAGLAVAVAIVGAGAFAASALMDWHVIRLTLPTGEGGSPATTTMVLGLGDTAAGVVYQLGVLFLLGVAGMVAVRPHAAARLRTATVGVGAGLLGVVFATVVEQSDWIRHRYGRLLPVQVVNELDQQMSASVSPGPYVAAAAVLLLTAGVWLAAAPMGALPPPAPALPAPGAAADVGARPPIEAVSASGPAQSAPAAPSGDAQPPAPPPGAPPAPAAPDPVPQVVGPASQWSSPVGYVEGLTVSPAEPIDIGPQSDILRG